MNNEQNPTFDIQQWLHQVAQALGKVGSQFRLLSKSEGVCVCVVLVELLCHGA